MVRNILISAFMLVLVGPAMLTLSGCCKTCDVQYEPNDLDYLVYNQSTLLTFESNLGNTITYKFDHEEINENGKSCGGGIWTEDFCLIRSRMLLKNVERQYPDLEVSVSRYESDEGLHINWDFGSKSFGSASFFQGTLDESSSQRIKTIMIGNATYDDVLDRLFQPLVDCKDPQSPVCVEIGDVVGHEYSLTRGLIAFQVHRGLQETNEIFTIVP